MIPADIDPSLCSGEPRFERLDDGFSPPPQQAAQPAPADRSPAQPAAPALGAKSLF